MNDVALRESSGGIDLMLSNALNVYWWPPPSENVPSVQFLQRSVSLLNVAPSGQAKSRQR